MFKEKFLKLHRLTTLPVSCKNVLSTLRRSTLTSRPDWMRLSSCMRQLSVICVTRSLRFSASLMSWTRHVSIRMPSRGRTRSCLVSRMTSTCSYTLFLLKYKEEPLLTMLQLKREVFLKYKAQCIIHYLPTAAAPTGYKPFIPCFFLSAWVLFSPLLCSLAMFLLLVGKYSYPNLEMHV